MVDGRDVTGVAEECAAFLDGAVDADWAAVVPEVGWTVGRTVAHIADCVLWYATNLAAGPPELSAGDFEAPADTPPAVLVRSLRAHASVLASVVTTAPPGARGRHPSGLPDASGFAAMACDEMLVHTHDAGRGLGLEFTPSPESARKVLRRLFPDAPTGRDPWRTLLWSNGRVPLGDLPRRTSWGWHSDPLDVRV